MPARFQGPNQRRTDHAAVAGHIDGSVKRGHGPKVQLRTRVKRRNINLSMFSRAFKRLAICAFWVCLRLQFGQFMRFVSLFLSLLVVTTAVAQKPLDRGVHKRKTGGVSVLWGKKKMHDVDRSELDAPNELLPRETLEPVVMRIPVAKVDELESPTGEWNPAPATFLTEDRLVHRVLKRPLKRRGFAVVAGPAFVDRLLRRDHALKSPSCPRKGATWIGCLSWVLF